MKKPLHIVLAFACAATLVFAQNEGASGPAPVAKPTSGPVIQDENSPAPAAPAPQAAAPPSATAQPTAPPAESAPKPAADNAAAPKPAAENGSKPYVIGPLDVLYVRVWNQPNLSGAVNVSPDGVISMQLIGEIKAAGLTAKQLRDIITQRLKECCVNNPEGEVDVQVAKNNSKFYYVYGGVGRPGEYPLDRDTSVMDAMSLVGGFRDFSNKKKIRILRGTQTFYFNYNEVSKGKHLDQNILLQNGDRIFVPE